MTNILLILLVEDVKRLDFNLFHGKILSYEYIYTFQTAEHSLISTIGFIPAARAEYYTGFIWAYGSPWRVA